jgi:hypothetical protein
MFSEASTLDRPIVIPYNQSYTSTALQERYSKLESRAILKQAQKSADCKLGNEWPGSAAVALRCIAARCWAAVALKGLQHQNMVGRRSILPISKLELEII